MEAGESKGNLVNIQMKCPCLRISVSKSPLPSERID